MATTKVYEWSVRWSLKLEDRNDEGLKAFKEKQKDLQMLLTLLCKKFVYQLELTGDWNWHYQGQLNLKTKKTEKTIVNDFQEQFPGVHFSKASTAGRKALQDYCLKDTTRKAGPWADHAIYRGQDLYTDPYPWQSELTTMCIGESDDRTIHWIYDKGGNSGKTKFAKLMAYKHKAGVMAYSKTSDLLNFVYKSDATIFIFDLTRAKPLDIGGGDLYAALESIKNGMVFNSKYETGCKLFAPPHVLVFANCKPELQNLSADRWRFHSLIQGEMYDGLHEDTPPVIVRANAMNFPPPVNIRGDEMEQPFNELVYIQPADDLAYIEDWEEKVGQFIDMECIE